MGSGRGRDKYSIYIERRGKRCDLRGRENCVIRGGENKGSI